MSEVPAEPLEKFETARLTPGRHMLSLVVKDGGVVGVLDWLERNPSDGHPWIGLVMVHGERQREGLGAEAVSGLLACLRRPGAAAVRAGVIERNPAGRALMHRLGFAPVSERTMRMAAAQERVLVFERSLTWV
jgi:RimJ/RimL family protein N-acetyltransferase